MKYLYNTILEALFPIPREEREILSIEPKQSFDFLARANISPIPEACGIFSYKDEHTRKLIWSIKYKKSTKGSSIAGYSLYQIIISYSKIASPIVVVPMPITKRRKRERGFNQCEFIVDEIKRLDKDHKIVIAKDILIRKVHISRQTMKDREERLESAKDIFITDNEAIKKLKINKESNYLILVIDDVITTGSTMLDAVTTLRKAGLEKTFGLAVAH